MRLIDADALKEAVSNNPLIDFTDDDIFELIDNAPTVEPCDNCEEKKKLDYLCHFSSYRELQALRKFKEEHERTQGEWKVHGKQGGIPIIDMCSNCRYEMKWYKNKYNFCPNCGADMRKEGE